MTSVHLKQLSQDIRMAGIREGDHVLLHSSLSSIGTVYGGAGTVVSAFLEVLNPLYGTLVVPTLTGSILDAPHRPPVFDVRHSTCWTGAIPEFARQQQGAIRSLNATHSVAAIGGRGEWITQGHDNCPSPCSENSPYMKLARMGGKIMLLGVTLDSNTTFHAVEEMAGSPYHLQREPTATVIMDAKGISLTRMMHLHDWGTPRRFRVVENELLNKGIMTRCRIGQADSFLINSESMVNFALERLLTEPDLFVQNK